MSTILDSRHIHILRTDDAPRNALDSLAPSKPAKAEPKRTRDAHGRWRKAASHE